MTLRWEPGRPAGAMVRDVTAITFDFGNTLVPVGRDGLRAVVERTIRAISDRSGPFDPEAFGAAWTEERERQFAEDVPRMREVDLGIRIVRVLARMRGGAQPRPGDPWDDGAAAQLSDPAEVNSAVEAYSLAFVETIPAPPEVEQLLARLARRYRLAIVSNWPWAATIDRFAAAAGWAPHLQAILVSQRVGAIKPDGTIFRAAEAALGISGPAILHVGDDWTADVVGAKRAGWRAVYVRARPPDSPLPGSFPSGHVGEVKADLEIGSLLELEAHLAAGHG